MPVNFTLFQYLQARLRSGVWYGNKRFYDTGPWPSQTIQSSGQGSLIPYYRSGWYPTLLNLEFIKSIFLANPFLRPALLARVFSVRTLWFGQVELDQPQLSLIMSSAKSQFDKLRAYAENTKGGSITVPLTSRLTGLD